MVFRIFDNILATGVEALFGFSLVMLQKNEEKLLAMKFDEVVIYLNNKIFDTYRVRWHATVIRAITIHYIAS